MKQKTENFKYTEQQVQNIKKEAFKKGVRHAAEIADTYNSSTSHPYRLGDCILGKLNQTNRTPRKNTQRLSK
jgi:hypothetical protein